MERSWRTRRYFRILYDSPVVVRINRVHRTRVRLAAKNITGKMMDISIGGCALEGDHFVPKGAQVNVFMDRSLFQLPQGGSVSKRPSRIQAVVISCLTRGPQRYRIGVKFSKVSRLDRDLIDHFIRFHERRKDPRIEF